MQKIRKIEQYIANKNFFDYLIIMFLAALIGWMVAEDFIGGLGG